MGTVRTEEVGCSNAVLVPEEALGNILLYTAQEDAVTTEKRDQVKCMPMGMH